MSVGAENYEVGTYLSGEARVYTVLHVIQNRAGDTEKVSATFEIYGAVAVLRCSSQGIVEILMVKSYC